MIESLQLEERTEIPTHDAPRLLVAWTPRWQDFVGSIRPAFARSEARLAGEAPFGLIPLRVMVPSYFLEAFVIFAAIAIPIKINQLRPYAAPRISAHEVIYYSGDELPRTEDLGGSESGRTGRAGGAEAHHRTQTIKIARGSLLTPRVVDAPNLKIPASRDAVANLLAIKPNAGPPPSEGLRSTRAVPNLSASVVAPAPNAIRDYTRNGIQLDQVIAPVPDLSHNAARDVTTAPVLSAKVIPPAPSISSDHPLYAPVLAPEVIPPAPKNVSRDRASNAPSLTASVVAPAPALNDHQSRSAPSLAASVIPPAPGAVSREVSSSPVQMAHVAVVPPPASAPERASTRDPKLTLPAPSVIAPPPSSDISQDMRRLASGSAPDPAKTVVPPPPTQSGSGSFLGNLVGKLFGASDVVPPPPTVNTNGSSSNSGRALAPNVVPPPPNVNASGQNSKPQLAANVVPPPATLSGTSATDSRGRGNGAGPSLNANVVAPPPSVGVAGGSGNRSMYSSTAPTLGAPNVVPPPPSLASIGGGTGKTAGGGGTLTAANVVPPPPAIGGGSASTGSGTGRKGPGFAGSLDVGAPPAPATNGGSGSSAGAVISSQPGSKVGLPAPSTGSLALSPAGGDKPGLGGSGAGTGIGRGTGPGSGMNGEASGAGKTGTARGSETSARGGISPTTGPGGAGNSNSGNPPVPGVSINGGSSEITLPSFGDDPAADPSSPNRTAARKHGDRLDVTVVASASAGGAFEAYKNLLHGETYTTYFDTSAGPLSMEFADEATGSHAFGGSLTAPSPIRIDLPEGLPRARLALKCTLDASGNVKNIHVLDAGPADMTAKVVSALRSWKFQPAMRATQPVEVTAILGFNIDTNDRF